MPKEKDFKVCIPSVYKQNAENLLLFGHITGIRRTIPGATIDACIKSFYHIYDICEDDFKYETARQIYFKMNEWYLKEK